MESARSSSVCMHPKLPIIVDTEGCVQSGGYSVVHQNSTHERSVKTATSRLCSDKDVSGQACAETGAVETGPQHRTPRPVCCCPHHSVLALISPECTRDESPPEVVELHHYSDTQARNSAVSASFSLS